MAAASQAARSAVTSFTKDFYEKKIFDPYLRFASAEDEERYRREEAQRKEEIEKALALHTPAGDLRANTLALEQLKDAGAHGASASPDYAPTLEGLTKTKEELQRAVDTQRSTAKAEERVADATSPQRASPAAPELSPDVLAAFRRVSTADTAQAGHGLDGRVAAISSDRTLGG